MPARLSSPDLVGRDDALSDLQHAIRGTASEGPAFVVVRGEAGIGKTRLVREALARLADERLVLAGECLDIGEAGLPYLPIVEAFRRLARTAAPGVIDEALGIGRRELVALVPELGGTGVPAKEVGPAEDALGPGTAPMPFTTGLAQARLFERVLGFLGALAARSPVVLVVEDVHWIDRATRDLLTFLARNLTDERVAVVLTFREHDLPRGNPILGWLAGLEGARSTVVVEPSRLDSSAVRRQLRSIAGRDLPAAVVDRIVRRSDGNPLFVEELFAADGDAGPRSLAEVLLARVSRLDPLARSVVDAAAVAGRPVDERLLAAVLDQTEHAVDRALEAAVAGSVLIVAPSTDRYQFRHELLREVVERELLPGTRRRLHERYARRLEDDPSLADPSPAGAIGELAVHFAAAGLAEEAYAHSIRAADAAESVHAYADAHRHLERALELEPRLPGPSGDHADRVAVRMRASDDADLAGEFQRALDLARQALQLVDPVRDPGTAAMLHSRVGYLLWSVGEGEAALASHQVAASLVPAEPPSRERAKVLGSLAGALMGEGRWADSRDVCQAAVACAVAAGAVAEESRARNVLGSDLVALGEIRAGVEQLREACRIAREAGRLDMLVIGHHNLSLNLAAADQLEEAVTQARAGLAVARESGIERRFGQDLAALAGDALTRLGRLDEAAASVAGGIALDPAGQGSVYLSTVAARIAAIRGVAGEAARRRADLDLPSLDPDVAAFVAATAAEARLLDGDPAAALAEAEAGLRALEGLDDVLWALPLVALGLRAVADLVEMVTAAPGWRPAGLQAARDRLADRLDWLQARTTISSGRGRLALARGELARADGSDDAAAWRQAVDAFDEVPEPLAAAYARLRLAECELRARGLRADVADLLGAAHAAATESGAEPLRTRVRELAARARIELGSRGRDAVPVSPGPAGRAAPPDPRAAALALGLSAREIEVLELVTAGLTNGQIAERLFITRKTAAVHVTHILDKLGVANRVGAAMVGARVGLRERPGAYVEEAAPLASE